MSFMLSVIYAEFHEEAVDVECRYAGCRYAECRGAILTAGVPCSVRH
jgi:hypothetical protein